MAEERIGIRMSNLKSFQDYIEKVLVALFKNGFLQETQIIYEIPEKNKSFYSYKFIKNTAYFVINHRDTNCNIMNLYKVPELEDARVKFTIKQQDNEKYTTLSIK